MAVLKFTTMETNKFTWSVSCESKQHIYKNWIVEASNELEAWADFLKNKSGTTKDYKNIKITKTNK